MPEDVKKSLGEYIIKYWSLLGAGVFVLSYVYHSIYYSWFNIDILNYIKLQDIILNILPYLLVFGLIVFFSLMVIAQSLNELSIYVTENKKDLSTEEKEIYNEQKERRRRKPIKQIGWLMLVTFVFLIINFIYHDQNNLPYLYFALLIELGVLVSLMNILYKRETLYGLVPYFFMILLLSIVGFSLLSGFSKKHFNSNLKTSLKYKDHLFSSDTTLIYVGETLSSMFFYNRKTSSAIILKKDNIDSVVITQIR